MAEYSYIYTYTSTLYVPLTLQVSYTLYVPLPSFAKLRRSFASPLRIVFLGFAFLQLPQAVSIIPGLSCTSFLSWTFPPKVIPPPSAFNLLALGTWHGPLCALRVGCVLRQLLLELQATGPSTGFARGSSLREPACPLHGPDSVHASCLLLHCFINTAVYDSGSLFT